MPAARMTTPAVAPSIVAWGAGGPLDPVLAAVRERGFRIFRAAGSAVGIVSLTVLGLHLLRAGATSLDLTGPFVLATLLVLGSWAVPARRHRLAAGPLVAAMAVIAVTLLWSIGPSLAAGALLVVIPLLATFFFGRRAAVWGAVGAGLVLAAVGVASWLAGRPGVGALPGATMPYPVYVRLAAITLGLLVMALGTEVAALTAVEAALRREREAAERERVEHERRTAAERALAHTKRLEAIVQLASGIAHDTRNALTVVSAGVQALGLLGRGSKQELEVVSDVQRALETMTATVQQLLSLGRRQSTPAQPLVLGSVMGPLAGALRRVIPADVEVRVEEHDRVSALVDRAGLEQALLNLALNARDAMPAGGVLTLRVGGQEGEAGGLAVVEVEDTGAGMDRPTAAHAFEPFFTTKPEGRGTGLGLFMVREFVTGAGGAIEVESEPGRGTRVRLLFPALEPWRVSGLAGERQVSSGRS